MPVPNQTPWYDVRITKAGPSVEDKHKHEELIVCILRNYFKHERHWKLSSFQLYLLRDVRW